MRGKPRTRLPKGWETLTDTQKRKHGKGLCVSPCCRNRAERHHRSRTILLYCTTCRCRKYTERNPIRIKFLNLKKSARRRGIEFSVTFPVSKGGEDTADNLRVLCLDCNVRRPRKHLQRGGFSTDRIVTELRHENARLRAEIARLRAEQKEGGSD